MLHAILGGTTSSFEGLEPLGGNCVFTLCRNQFRAIDLEQRLSLAHRLTGDIDMQAFDIAFEFGGNCKDAALVWFNPTRGSHNFVEGAQLGGLSTHPELLHFLDTDLDLVGRSRFVVLFVFVDRDIVHPHRVFLGYRRGIGQAHRIAVVEQLAFFLRRLSGGNRCVRTGSLEHRAFAASQPVPPASCDGKRQYPDAQSCTLVHSSSPSNRSISASRT
ncbi:hypothetical protein SDC9_125892 [bioreactor metagenome]|uniref:Uncharacterized protein n=1 Tax=bioreactor metagenome TaxID=1076179 RepID=A0A645CPP1_9ZZZZ